MKKRVLAAFLWFYTGWYAGAMIAAFFGLTAAFGPVLGAAAVGLFVGDPFHLFWARPGEAAVLAPVEPAPEGA